MLDNEREPVGLFGVPMDLAMTDAASHGAKRHPLPRIEAALENLGHGVTDLGNAGVPIPEVVAAGEEVKHLAAVKSVCEEVSQRAVAIVS